MLYLLHEELRRRQTFTGSAISRTPPPQEIKIDVNLLILSPSKMQVIFVFVSGNTQVISMALDDILRSYEAKQWVCPRNWILFTTLLPVIQSLSLAFTSNICAIILLKAPNSMEEYSGLFSKGIANYIFAKDCITRKWVNRQCNSTLMVSYK